MPDRAPSAYRCSSCSQGWGVSAPLGPPVTSYPAQMPFPCPKCETGALVADYGGAREDDFVDFLVADVFSPLSPSRVFSPLIAQQLSKDGPDQGGTPHAAVETKWSRRYRDWITENPRVLELADAIALKAIARGKRLSSGSIVEILRWEAPGSWADDDAGYRVNQNFGAYLIRDLAERHPDLRVEFRRLRSEGRPDHEHREEAPF